MFILKNKGVENHNNKSYLGNFSLASDYWLLWVLEESYNYMYLSTHFMCPVSLPSLENKLLGLLDRLSNSVVEAKAEAEQHVGYLQ